jgi:hypothetical protein
MARHIPERFDLPQATFPVDLPREQPDELREQDDALRGPVDRRPPDRGGERVGVVDPGELARLADRVSVLKPVQVTGHCHIKRQHWTASSVTSAHVQGEHRGPLRDAQQLRLLRVSP